MYNDSGDLDLPAKVDHPCGSVDVEVIQHCAGLERRVCDAVDSSAGVTVLPASTNMTLHLASVTDPRLLVVRHVLHCITTTSNNMSVSK